MSQEQMLIKIDEKLDKLQDKVHDMEVSQVKELSNIHQVLIKQEENLADHILRTKLAEERIETMEEEIKPLLQSLVFFKKLFQFAMAIATVIYTIIKIKKL